MTIPEKAVEWALMIADDDSHGYDQGTRWGPDYDCSSLVISAYKHAGVPLNCTYTGNMYSDMLLNGFSRVGSVNLQTGEGLKLGDVLLNERNHTALYIGDGKLVHASGNEYGGATGGQTGDQTGREICVVPYFNYGGGGWDFVLRYTKEEKPEPKPTPNKYTVQSGDTLWGIAERFLGAGERYVQIMSANSLTTSMIYPGQTLVIPTGGTIYRTIQITVTSDTLELLTIMAAGWDKSIGQVIDALVEDAV